MAKPASRRSAKGQTATVTVRVKNAQAPFTWSFRNHVIPVMTKMGCNQGACHGALAGKNGFKLTLRGYDPDARLRYTDAAGGRPARVARRPAASLILAKPSFAIPHGGGKRFAKDSLEYRVIEEWIAAGAPPPSSKDIEISGLGGLPGGRRPAPKAEQQLVGARAVLRRPHRGCHPLGQVQLEQRRRGDGGRLGPRQDDRRGRGGGHALVFQPRALRAARASRSRTTVTAEAYEQVPAPQFHRRLVLAKWKNLRLAPSKIADDATFLRRAYLDAAGHSAYSEEVENFLADKSPDKRAKVVEKLLEARRVRRLLGVQMVATCCWSRPGS